MPEPQSGGRQVLFSYLPGSVFVHETGYMARSTEIRGSDPPQLSRDARHVDQLAATLRTTTTSSTFRSLVASARTFGLIHRRAKAVSLTELGSAIVDPLTREDAKVRAFLEVPLYHSLYERFAGVLLPADAGLEAEIEALGVTPKSVVKARQTLMRSAAVAGFLQAGKDRLVRPPTGRAEDASAPDEAAATAQTTTTPEAPTATSIDPLLDALWARLPINGKFLNPERASWLRMLGLALDMIYGPAEDKATADSKDSSRDDDPF